MSSVSFSSLSAPSTCSASTMRAMRRSTLAKSSIEIVRRRSSRWSPRASALRPLRPRAGLRGRRRRRVSSSASTFFGSMRVIRCAYGPIARRTTSQRRLQTKSRSRPNSSRATRAGDRRQHRREEHRQQPKPAARASRRPAARSRCAGSFASAHGFARSKRSLMRSAMRITSRIALPILARARSARRPISARRCASASSRLGGAASLGERHSRRRNVA